MSSVHCFGSKKLKSRFPETKAVQSRVRKQYNCPSFGDRHVVSHIISTEQATVVLNYTVQKSRVPVSVKHADYGLGINGYKRRIEA